MRWSATFTHFGEKTRDTTGCIFGRVRQALQGEHPKQDRRLARSQVAAVYKSQMRVRRMRPRIQKASRKWIEARLVVRKARLHRLQKLLVPATQVNQETQNMKITVHTTVPVSIPIPNPLPPRFPPPLSSMLQQRRPYCSSSQMPPE
jgi:hypothetical protein